MTNSDRERESEHRNPTNTEAHSGVDSVDYGEGKGKLPRMQE